MNNAEMYQQNNSLQKRDAVLCLEENASKIEWKTHGDSIIDIGCGDGSVTTNILKNIIPRNFHSLVGCDVSEKMVKFANKHFAGENTTFIVLDIEGKLPRELYEKFNHAFSFYALHWVKQQKIAFTNIYNLLAKGGDCLLMFLGHMPIFDVYRILARSSRWSLWLKDIDRFISPYHDCRDPEKVIKRMMGSIGFTNMEVKCTERQFIYNSEESIKKAVTAVNPFEIPHGIYEEFLEDYLKILKEEYLINQVSYNNVKGSIVVRTNYTVITVYGKKT